MRLAVDPSLLRKIGTRPALCAGLDRLFLWLTGIFEALFLSIVGCSAGGLVVSMGGLMGLLP